MVREGEGSQARRRLRLPSPAMVVALLALFVALGAGAYAVTKAPKNSVTSKSIKNGAVKGVDIAKGTTIQSATIADLPSGPNATVSRNPIGEVAHSGFVGAFAPVKTTVADLFVYSPLGLGEARKFAIVTGANVELVNCTATADTDRCESNQKATIPAGADFSLKITNGAAGANSPIGVVAYTLKAK